MNKTDVEMDEIRRTVVKFTTTENVGVKPTQLTSNAIGYIIRGEKSIHDDDLSRSISQGELFFIPQGRHYIENIPAPNESFEQILLYFTPDRLQQIVASLHLDRVDLTRGESSDQPTVASTSPSKITRNIITSMNRHFELGGFLHNDESERLFMMQLIHSILSQDKGDVREAILLSLDSDRADFERIIYNNLLNDKSVEELASECSRSLTSFKKEFKRIFGTPPHQWYLRQRLNYAKLLLTTTRESISQVGNTCAFPNTSHFIKLFKRHFGTTPASFRAGKNRGTIGGTRATGRISEIEQLREKAIKPAVSIAE